LKNKKEQDRLEMKRILEEQIAEKKKRQEEDRKKREEEDIKFEKTMANGFRNDTCLRENKLGKTQEIKPIPEEPESIQNLKAKSPEESLEKESSKNEQTPKKEASNSQIKVEEGQLELEETPQKIERQKSENDERWEVLKSQIQVFFIIWNIFIDS